jgi:hypothetical protein|uniref:Uncharacterized protein n=1 Tax=viral metagenome TaxID=1070528 RepID=A0A6C0AHL1_9ZZZZ
MACSNLYPLDNDIIYHTCVLACPYSITLTTPELAWSFFWNLLRMNGYVEGGPIPGKPRKYGWFFHVNPRLKDQMSPRLLAILESLQRGETIKEEYGVADKKGKIPFHMIVVSNHDHHRQVTGPVDMEVYKLWGKKMSYREHQFLIDPSLRDASAKYMVFGSFDPELIEPEPLKD